MTERIQRSYELPCSPDELLAGLAQPDVVQRRSDADGLGTRIVKHEVSDDAVRIVVSTDVPLDWLPSAITSRLGGSPTVERGVAPRIITALDAEAAFYDTLRTPGR